MSPLKSPCNDRGIKYTVKKIATDCSGIYTDEEEPQILGYTTALSTISGLRGFDASDVKIWIFDEFIPERHERAIKCEGEAFLILDRYVHFLSPVSEDEFIVISRVNEDFTMYMVAGFVVALTGAIMTMPGLPKHPAAENIDVDADGKISGLF